ncbi:hypothetical protein G6F56_001296 [Rhizopus delemar]|uniref:GAR domain-containing protein n=1 Tax=Rhizopus stolonifer TaxID=4846 RepID=A0A367KTI7_RHIST|nr:hypothetical protein G6F56_001296 [Rhizopus delemar]RCI05523.1 hypothetical protein CU098_011503 [Rhizopus stolonifer]
MIPAPDENSWQNGIYLLACLHYHHPIILSDLNQYISLDNSTVLNKATQLIYHSYNISCKLDDDETNMISYYIEHLIPLFTFPDQIQTAQRDQDIERFKSTQTTTTTTATYSYQQLRVTKTTKYSSDNEIPTELHDFDSRSQSLSEKIASLQQRLDLIVPTRNNTYSPLTNSVGSECIDLFLTDDNTSTTTKSVSSSHVDDVVRLLHPLQAAEEDYVTYDRLFKALQSDFITMTDGDYRLFMLSINQLDPSFHQHPLVIQRKTQLHQAYSGLSQELEKSDMTLCRFRKGFAFARMCHSIRQELEFVQNKMVKSITCHQDIEELEQTMDKTTEMVSHLQFSLNDLSKDQEDPAYAQKYQLIDSKNQLVRGWVDEVRIWFTEAERIRQWIEIRVEQIKSTTLPDPLSDIDISRDQVESLNGTHTLLEREIEAFDKEDMARLRSHVKSLTGSGRAKDLSPADTTTIEITLTTLMSLDKLMHLLRRKSDDLQVLTRRVVWEEEYERSMAWLEQTEEELDQFLSNGARWSESEEQESASRERLMAKEKLKETVVQQLLTLERKRSEFDQGQFTKTVESFQDLDSASAIELPAHLESKQNECEQRFEDLMKRMAFGRNVVEQRLNVMDFLYQTELVMDDTSALTLDIKDAESKAHPGENDREITSRVQTMHERIIQLVTVSASRIPYPESALAQDEPSNTDANEEINQVINDKRNQLMLLSEELDQSLDAYRNLLQLHRRAKDHMDDAVRLCDWAEERIQATKRAKSSLQQDAASLTIDDLQRLERECQSVMNKLKNGKENEVVDLLTRIQQLLDTTAKLNIVSIDSDQLTEISSQLEERFDRLQQILDEHALELDALRKKLEDGNSYFESARALRSFMSDTRLSLPALKQTCGFMTGQSKEQDQSRYQELQESMATVQIEYKNRQAQFNQLCSRFRNMDPTKVEADTRTLQQDVENEWEALGKDIDNLQQFSDMVGQWYDRQRRLSLVGNDYLNGLQEEIGRLARSERDDGQLEAIQRKIDQASLMLAEIGTSIHEAQDDEKQDPLQIANYSCARDRHSLLVSKLQAASASLDALRSNAHTSLAFSSFLNDTDRLLNALQDQKDKVHRDMLAVGQHQFGQSLATTKTLEALVKQIILSTKAVEVENTRFQGTMKSLLERAKQFEPQSAEKRTAHASLMTLQENMNQLKEMIANEKRQAMFIQKIQTHTKAAEDVHAWIRPCAQAISQLSNDVCVADEQDLLYDLDHLDQRISGMQPTLQHFLAMPQRIWNNVNGDPINVAAFSLDRDQIKRAIEQRESEVMKAWNENKENLAKVRASVDQSKRGVEAARKVKAILVQVGDLKDRVNAVKICRNRPADQDDLQTVLSCSLSDVPNEHRLASAKAELAILDRDVECLLVPAIKQLDVMLQTYQSNEDMFEDQRKEITSAARSLMDLLKSKRRATAEAEKMQDFLTVMEEVEVLLLALAEVVARASPDHARTNPDGSFLRTDLQALLIDLDTRYKYYEPKIIELIDEQKQVAENLMDDERVVECIEQFLERWQQLQSEAATRKQELSALIGPMADSNFDYIKATEGMLLERGRRANKGLNKRRSAPVLAPEPKPTLTTPRYMTGYNRKPAEKANNGNVSPTARRVAARTVASQRLARKTVVTPDAYVADPQNDLDVAVGNIVNDSPYKIKIKMVPGEVGKYWFGEVNPKLAYCRILRSRMVMVRVGGGWVELSQFLRDHALLESDNVTPNKTQFRTSLPPPSSPRVGVQEGYLNVATIGRNSANRRSYYDEGSPALMKESRSTPYYRGMTPVPTYGGNGLKAGIKAGNKFLVTDDKGNQVQVKMTKANDAKFFTPRRINI